MDKGQFVFNKLASPSTAFYGGAYGSMAGSMLGSRISDVKTDTVYKK